MVPIKMNQKGETAWAWVGDASCFMLTNPVGLFELCFLPCFPAKGGCFLPDHQLQVGALEKANLNERGNAPDVENHRDLRFRLRKRTCF
ncbi:hypothetical protein FKM82_012165 [Ascaphus truei]